MTDVGTSSNLSKDGNPITIMDIKNKWMDNEIDKGLDNILCFYIRNKTY
jgi:hypothetical protein